ncbi:MAG TPA: glycoside hydrolase family 3 N-terminal domain-containing protein [Terriglobia bacterium]|nr:glycoside hydrolase family 3 N-terminal domain-containing protein [Terriglobia bacterium]
MKTQLGQLLMIEVSRASWNSGLERLLDRFRPAGVFLRSLDSSAATAELAAKSARALGSVPFLAVEEQGAGSLCHLFNPLADAGSMNVGDAARAGDLMGSAMALLGLNLDLAPVLDLPGVPGGAVTNPPEPLTPASSSLAALVAEKAEGFVAGLARHGILACGRHFPGAASLAKGAGAPARPRVVAKTMMTLWREDLVPYRRLGPKLAMVEITSAICKAYDYEFPRPASLSANVMEGLLRVKLGYQGVALVDASAAAGASEVDTGEAAVRALAAGCDLLLVSGEGREIELVFESLERALEFGKLAPERVEQALQRVRSARKRLRRPGKAPSERALERLALKFEEFGRQGAAVERDIA